MFHQSLLFINYMLLIAIESSCDETAAAVIRDDGEILSEVVASQAHLFAEYGGVVPEIASRAHMERILPVIDQAVKRAGIQLSDLDAGGMAVAVGDIAFAVVTEMRQSQRALRIIVVIQIRMSALIGFGRRIPVLFP